MRAASASPSSMSRFGLLVLAVLSCRDAQAGFRTIYPLQVTSDGGALEVVEAADGGYAIAAGRPMFLLKTNSSGNLQFAYAYTADQARSLCATAGGGFLLAGSQRSDAVILQVDALGLVQSSRMYPSISAGLRSVRPTSDGGAIAASGLAMKLDAAGLPEWGTLVSGIRITDPGWGFVAVAPTSDGGVIAVGQGREARTDADQHVVAARLDAAGGVAWRGMYRGAGSDSALSCAETSDGGYIVAGWTDSFGAGGRDALLLRLDAAGNVQWARVYGTTKDDVFNDVRETADGGLVAAGQLDGRPALMKADGAGLLLWAHAFPVSVTRAGGELRSVLETSDGSLVAAGQDESGLVLMVKADAAGDIGGCGQVDLTLLTSPAALVPRALTMRDLAEAIDSASVAASASSLTMVPFECAVGSNRAPSCTAGLDMERACDGVVLGGTAASDPDGDPLTIAWTSSCPGTTFDPSPDVLGPMVTFGLGCSATCDLTLRVDDGNGGIASDTTHVVVRDLTPPSFFCPLLVRMQCGDAVPPPDPASMVAVDACSGPATVTFVSDVVAGTCPVTVDRTYRATDACGNSVDCTQRFLLQPGASPETACANGLDDDGDTLIDCNDADCTADAAADCDGDGTPNGADCAPADPSAVAVPGIVPSLVVVKSPAGDALLQWSDVAAGAGTGTVYDVAGGQISALWRDRGFASVGCVAQDVATTTASDSRPIPPHPPRFRGDGWYYVVRAQDACGSSTYGDGSFGPRAIDARYCD